MELQQLIGLLKKYEEIVKSELLSFQVFTDESGTIYSHHLCEQLDKYKWQEKFTSIEDAIHIMTIKLALTTV